jgi:sugar fermentation stimulation protein A
MHWKTSSVEQGDLMNQSGYKLPPLIRGSLIKRYKRFLADVKLDTGEVITAHCPNSGSMKGCAIEGAPVWLSISDNPKRKYKHTWELVESPSSLIGINTMVPNRLVKLSIENGVIEELKGFDRVRPEVKTNDHTRLDLMLESDGGQTCYVEIKNCTLVEKGTAMFPDAVTTRGQKHLNELERLVFKGNRGVIFYLIQRTDATVFKPADAIDPVYGQRLRQVVKNGVEIVTRDVRIDHEMICIGRKIPVNLGA